MSLAKYLKIDLFLSNIRMVIVLEQKKKIHITATHKGFTFTANSIILYKDTIFSIKSDTF